MTTPWRHSDGPPPVPDLLGDLEASLVASQHERRLNDALYTALATKATEHAALQGLSDTWAYGFLNAMWPTINAAVVPNDGEPLMSRVRKICKGIVASPQKSEGKPADGGIQEAERLNTTEVSPASEPVTGDPVLPAVTAATVADHLRYWHHPQTEAIGRMVGRTGIQQHEVDHERLPDASGRPKDGHSHRPRWATDA